jgi:hypothetical protein
MKFNVELFAKGGTFERVQALYFSPDFDAAVAEAANLVERKQSERTVNPDGTERMRTRIVPRISLPGPMLKLVNGRTIYYDEITLFDAKARRATLSIRSFAGRAVQVNGTVDFIEEPGGVRLCFAGEARVDIFALGPMIERYLVSEVKARYAKVEPVLQRFLDSPAPA